MNRSNTKTFLPTTAICLAAVLCSPAAAEQPKPPAKTQPTTQPAKVKIIIGKDTTYITAPLNKDGTVNYVAYLNAKNGKAVTPRNNAVVLLVRASGPGAWPADTLDKTLKGLGMAALPVKGNYLQTWDEFIANHPQGEKYQDGEVEMEAWDAVSKPWSADEEPVIAQWIKANAKPLALVVEASKRPRYYVPLASTLDPPSLGSLAHLGMVRVFCVRMLLNARAMLKIKGGDLDGAWSDLMALHRLSRLFSQDSGGSALLLAQSLVANASIGSFRAITEGKMSLRKLRACQADLNALNALGRMEDTFIFHRLVALDAIATLARSRCDLLTVLAKNDTAVPKKLASQLRGTSSDWNAMLRGFNQWYDKPDRAMIKKGVQHYQEALEGVASQLFKDLLEPKDRGENERKPPAKPTTPTEWLTPNSPKASAEKRAMISRHVGQLMALVKWVEREWVLSSPNGRLVGAAAYHRLLLAATALAIHEAETGRFPSKLADLAPKYIKTLPIDPYSEKPLRYRREGKGCVVYSVGMNLKDDGGVKGYDEEEDQIKDDIAVRFER